MKLEEPCNEQLRGIGIKVRGLRIILQSIY